MVRLTSMCGESCDGAAYEYVRWIMRLLVSAVGVLNAGLNSLK